MYSFLIVAVNLLFRVFSTLILVYCIMSWFVRPYTALYRAYLFLADLVEPLIYPFRRITEGIARGTGIDFAPWLTLMFFSLLQNLLYLIIRMIFL